MNELRGTIFVNLLAQSIDIDFHQVGFAIEVAVPNVLDDFTARDQFGSMKQEQLEQRKFLGRQWDYLGAARGAPTMTIQREVRTAHLGIAAVKAAAHQRSNSSQEFCQGKRLSEIVIGTGIQSGYPLLDQASRGEHQDRSFYALLAKLTADLEAAHTGQPNVQENSVVGDIRGEVKRLLASLGHVNSVGIFPQGTGDEAGDLPFIFD